MAALKIGAVTHHHSLLKLPRWQKRWLYASFALLLFTGLAWLFLHYGQAEDAMPSPAEPWLIRLHGFAGFGALMGLGAIGGSHIPAGWRLTRRHRRPMQRNSGLLLSALLGLVLLSTYALYYFAPDGVRGPLGWAHSLLAGSAIAMLWLHRRRRHT
ncbi:hypothetical protein [Roseateles albus]|uniref:DUF4405 domain-containing protein n=1 Tax=Roseateles albus TaxID=2987525 RepID=A0ABT5KHP2_9BURK|nr:hypothetical protein [Roseateles albus]MDC8773465.1 hypothetical protein [Roseateles albus]